MQPVMAITTVPDIESAKKISEVLINENIAACVQVIPGMKSFYRWKGTLEESSEYLMFVKTTSDRSEELISRIESIHPYEVPEVIVLNITGGASNYIDWVRQETRRQV